MWSKPSALFVVLLSAFTHSAIADVTVPQETQQKFPGLIQLIRSSESMDDNDRQYWINNLPIMTGAQVTNLRQILENEKQQLDAIGSRYSSLPARGTQRKPSWITSIEGAKLWNDAPQANETCTWSGKIDGNGFATGAGLVVWYVNGKAVQAHQGYLSAGRAARPGITLSADGKAFVSSPTATQYDLQVVPRTPSRKVARAVPPSRSQSGTVRGQSPARIREAVKEGIELASEVRKAIPPKVSADLIVRSVSVLSTKSNGKPWDSGDGKPDLKVEINAGRFSTLTTSVSSNATYASFNKEKLRVSEGDVLSITVYDQDAFSDDVVGKYRKTITADTLRQGTATWSFDRVSSLVVKFEL